MCILGVSNQPNTELQCYSFLTIIFSTAAQLNSGTISGEQDIVASFKFLFAINYKFLSKVVI